MTQKDFEQFCSETQPGTRMLFHYRGKETTGTFVACTAEDEVVIEANGHYIFWPREVGEARKGVYAVPSYS